MFRRHDIWMFNFGANVIPNTIRKEFKRFQINIDGMGSVCGIVLTLGKLSLLSEISIYCTGIRSLRLFSGSLPDASDYMLLFQYMRYWDLVNYGLESGLHLIYIQVGRPINKHTRICKVHIILIESKYKITVLQISNFRLSENKSSCDGKSDWSSYALVSISKRNPRIMI